MQRSLHLAAALCLLGCNQPPEAGELAITPAEPVTTDDLVAAFEQPVVDPNDDDVTLTWTWRRDGVVVDSVDSERVPAGLTARGEVWEVEVVASDDRDEVSETMSAVATVRNSPPTLSGVGLPETATTEEDLVVALEPADLDGDDVVVELTWSLDGSLTTWDERTLPATETSKGQTWEVEVSTADQDGPGAAERYSVAIINSAPSLSGATIDPQEVREASVLTCVGEGWADADGDPQSADVTWFVNGEEVATTSELTGASFDKGDEITCRATPNDGSELGEPVVSAPVTVQNTAPEIASLAISPDDPGTEDALEALLGEVIDPDGDETTLAYRWTVDGDEVGTGTALEAASHAKGDVIGLSVVANDGVEDSRVATAEVTILNTAPTVVSAAITPGTARTNDLLGLGLELADVDGDDVTADVTWKVNGVSAGTGATLDGTTAFDKGDVVLAEVTPDDGDEAGTTVSTASITIANSPPTAPTVVIDPASPTPGEQLDCLLDEDAVDDDGDTLTYTASWTVDGVPSKAATTTDFTNDTIPADTTVDDEEWTCTVTASDGTDTGPSDSDTVAVLAWSGKRTFTHCGATGQHGPTQTACNSAYSTTPLHGEVTVSSGKQQWTAPLDGTYRIEVWGAQGGCAEPGRHGGRGARMRGDVPLKKGQVLTVIVGQQGTVNSCNGGGGGASAVYRGSTPLVIAGGGGGVRAAASQNGCDANTAQQAGTGSRHHTTHGCGLKSASTIGNGGVVSSSSWGSGGASVVSNGAGEYTPLNGGQALISGSAAGGGTGTYRAHGGFGGGGAGNGSCGGGGGGGYSGGDGGLLAGAGGSYNGGSSQSNSAGARSGMGLVMIDRL